MSKLINISKQYKIKADKLLAKTGLIKNLKKFGQVHLVGAYSLGLMMHGDIDLEVTRVKKYSRREVLHIFNYLYWQNKFKSYFIGGKWDDPRIGKEFPNGYYLGMKTKFANETWTIDVWFMDKKEFVKRTKKSNLFWKKISNKERELILALKKFRNDNKIKIAGYQIYELVLKGKIGSLKEFKDYLKRERIAFGK
jgi:hypothetical protein